jgi:2'-5' RNA ligase
MHLSGTGTFRPASPVVFVQVARGVADCEALEAAVRARPLARELDLPNNPHLTIAQGVDDASLDAAYDGMSGFVARFNVERFVLFCRDCSGRWQWRREFPLADPDAAGEDAIL